MSVRALFPGDCVDCDVPIKVGDRIVDAHAKGVDDVTGWGHEECPPPPARPKTCPKCFTELAVNGKCACFEEDE